MNELEISCASTDRKSNAWDSIDWLRCEIAVKKLQARIVKAQKEGRYGKVKALQWDANAFVLRQSIGRKAGDL